MVGGPVSIFHISGESARRGMDTLLSLLAFLSVELGILNLLPIPILDGGHMLFLGIEWVRRKPLSVKQRIVLQQIGLAVILLVMVTVTVFDVGRLLR
jgi:regulator of sigma E protease